ncbi:Zinc finger protein JAGGED-like [Hirschfeldia incana]|nr:Zinc finger protein JAGGED-like [Hirschfeldia incana]
MAVNLWESSASESNWLSIRRQGHRRLMLEQRNVIGDIISSMCSNFGEVDQVTDEVLSFDIFVCLSLFIMIRVIRAEPISIKKKRAEPMSSPRTGSGPNGTSNWSGRSIARVEIGFRRRRDSNALDLNNLPDDPSRDFFPFFEEGSSSSSSERETESLNKARELVLRNDTFPSHQGPPSFSYHQGDLITPFKPMMYPPRLFSPSSLLPPPPPPFVQPYIYPPPPPLRPSSFPPCHTNDYYLHNSGIHHQTVTNSSCGGRGPPDSSSSFIGAPVANGSKVAPPISHPLPPHDHGI